MSKWYLRLTFLLLFLICDPLFALRHPDKDLDDVGVKTILGGKVDLSLKFTESTGQEVALSDLVSDGKPLIIVPAYFDCPRLCGLVLKGVATMLDGISLNLGQDFHVASISFDDREKFPSAAEASKKYHEMLRDPLKKDVSWRFFVSAEGNVKTLMNQIGFHFKRDGEEFAHGAAIMILTPDGEISQYFTGIDFSPFDVKLALVEAAKGEIGTPLDHVFLFCFRFDETKGKYIWAAFNLMRAGAMATFIFLVGLISTLIVRERRRSRVV